MPIKKAPMPVKMLKKECERVLFSVIVSFDYSYRYCIKLGEISGKKFYHTWHHQNHKSVKNMVRCGVLAPYCTDNRRNAYMDNSWFATAFAVELADSTMIRSVILPASDG